MTVSFNYFGKIVLKIRDEESKKVIVPAPKQVLAVPKSFVDPEKTYVIIGSFVYILYSLNFKYKWFYNIIVNFY